MATNQLVAAIATLALALGAGAGYLASSAYSAETAKPFEANDGADTGILAFNDTVSVDATTFLEDQPWKTTYGWVARLIAESQHNNATVNESKYRPLSIVVGADYATDPIKTRMAAALEGRRTGEHFVLHVHEPFGSAAELQRVEIPRSYGPYEISKVWPAETFREKFGEPVVGTTVSTNRLFNSTVVETTDTSVTTRSDVLNERRIALPFMNALLWIEPVGEDQVMFRIDPRPNVSFRISDREDGTHFGLRTGHHLLANVTESTIIYTYHPKWSPPLVGLSFDVVIDVHEKLTAEAAADQPPATNPPSPETVLRENETHEQH